MISFVLIIIQSEQAEQIFHIKYIFFTLIKNTDFGPSNYIKTIKLNDCT